MLQVEHSQKQKIVSLIWFLGMACFAIIGVLDMPKNNSFVSKLATIFGSVLFVLIFAYPCWFTFTYRFQTDDTKIVRRTGFSQTEVNWADVTTWSIEVRPKKNTFNKEPILKNVEGQQISLNARVWYSSPNMAQARKQFLILVQEKLPDKFALSD